MLSTIGRAAIRRVVGRGPQSTNSALRSLWHLQYTGTFHDPNSSSALSKSSSSLGRCYATATKAASKPKATTAKTAKPKKAVAKKAVKKPVKKLAKKKVVKKLKAKPKGRPKKILTPEEAKKAAARQVVKEQKAKALSPPKNLPQTAWTVLASEWAKAHPEGKPSPLIGASAKYKSLSPAELEVRSFQRLIFFSWLTIFSNITMLPTRTRLRMQLHTSSGSNLTHQSKSVSQTMPAHN
jgi:hypothetical protein